MQGPVRGARPWEESIRVAMVHLLVSHMLAEVERWRPGAGEACAAGTEGLVLWAAELLREQRICGTGLQEPWRGALRTVTP